MLEQDRKDLERRIAELQRRKAAERAEADRAARGGASGSTNRVRTDSARTIRPDAKSYAQRPEKQLVAPPSYIREDRAASGQKKKRPDGQKRPSGQRPRDGQRPASQRTRDGQRPAGSSQRPRDGQRPVRSQQQVSGQRQRDGQRPEGPRPATSRKKSLEAARKRKRRKQIWMMQRVGVVLGLVLALVLFFWMVTLIGKAIGKSIAENKKAKEAATATTEAVVTEAATEATVTDADPRYPVFEEPAEYSSDAMRERGVPEELIEFYEKYPEVAPYAWFFPEKHEIDYDMDISKEVTKGTIPYFCQWDDRWGYKDYGSSYMGVNGCGPTCITMVYSGLTGKTDYTPYDMAIYVRDRGYYVPGSGTVWATMETIPPELGLTVLNVQFDAEGIRSTLRDGHPIICNVGPGDFTKVGHYILLAGVDDEGKIIVHDPNSPERTAKHWDVDVLIPQIRNLWGYSYQE